CLSSTRRCACDRGGRLRNDLRTGSSIPSTPVPAPLSPEISVRCPAGIGADARQYAGTPPTPPATRHRIRARQISSDGGRSEESGRGRRIGSGKRHYRYLTCPTDPSQPPV